MKPLLFCVLLFMTFVASAKVFQLPQENSRLIGSSTFYQVEKGDYFQSIAEYHDVGMLSLIAANPSVDPFLPKIGDKLVIPTQMLLPYAERKGIVINLAELRLYYFPPNEKLVYVFPVGIGRQGLSTPRVISYIGDKRKDPVWRPTKAMRERYKQEKGLELAKEVPPGPSNPFGKFALRLGTSEYLIHGTNQRMGVGMRASSGCIRMYAQDIKWLFENIAVGTQVRIVDQAIKMSYEPDGKKLMEIHQPLSDSEMIRGDSLPPAIASFIGESDTVQAQYNQQLVKSTGTVWTLPVQTQ